MTATAAGGPMSLIELKDAPDVVSADVIRAARYAQAEPLGDTYLVRVAPLRLEAHLHRSETGWVATVPEVNAVGYGRRPENALSDLAGSFREYLEFLQESSAQLAPAITYHARYISLLDVPTEEWFASVVILDEDRADDASELE